MTYMVWYIVLEIICTWSPIWSVKKSQVLNLIHSNAPWFNRETVAYKSLIQISCFVNQTFTKRSFLLVIMHHRILLKTRSKPALDAEYCQQNFNGFYWNRVCHQESPVFAEHSTQQTTPWLPSKVQLSRQSSCFTGTSVEVAPHKLTHRMNLP